MFAFVLVHVVGRFLSEEADCEFLVALRKFTLRSHTRSHPYFSGARLARVLSFDVADGAVSLADIDLARLHDLLKDLCVLAHNLVPFDFICYNLVKLTVFAVACLWRHKLFVLVFRQAVVEASQFGASAKIGWLILYAEDALVVHIHVVKSVKLVNLLAPINQLCTL